MAFFDIFRRASTLPAPIGGLAAFTPAGPQNLGAPNHDPGEMWETQPSVRIVTGEIAREVGSIPIHHFRRTSDTDRERLSGSRVADLLRSPAPGYGSARWFEQVILDLAVWDRWAALVDIDPETGSASFLRLPAHRCAVAVDGGRRVGVVYVAPNGHETLIPLDRVVYDVAPSAVTAATRDRGASRLRTITPLTDELDAAGEWRAQVFRNGARVPAVIERPLDAPRWDDAVANRFKSQFDAYREGGGNEGGTPILEDGMKLKAADVFKPSDFDTAAIRQLTLIEACLLYHYPPELLGAREGNYSNIEAFREMKYRDVLGSWIVNLEQALNNGLRAVGLLPVGEYVEANVDAKLRGAFETESKAFTSATGRPWMTTNEVRARKNLPRIDGGDDIVTPLNVITGGLANPRDTAPENNDPKA